MVTICPARGKKTVFAGFSPTNWQACRIIYINNHVLSNKRCLAVTEPVIGSSDPMADRVAANVKRSVLCQSAGTTTFTLSPLHISHAGMVHSAPGLKLHRLGSGARW